MAKASGQTMKKREKERARQEKQKQKEAHRIETKERKANAPPQSEGEDPDIAGISAGPQPLPPQFDTTPSKD
jgi:hypothetical protein